MLNLTTRFREYIAREHLFDQKDKLLLAVSGGVDSVVLCELCSQAGYDFEILHCNFRLRGEESERDEQFVRSLAAKYQVTAHIKHFDTAAAASAVKKGIQETARILRYSWFREVQQAIAPVINARTLILTAHHLSDNIETSVMHFFRGSGISGIRGMLPKQNGLIKPLLFASREDLLVYAQEQDLQWVEDSSNTSEKYTRNYFRHQVLPLVQQVYPEAARNLAANLQRFAETEILYREAVAMHLRKLLERKGNEVHIPVLKLKKLATLHTLLFEIVREYGFSSGQVPEIAALLDSETGRYMASATHRVIRNRNWLIIAPLAGAEAAHIIIEGPGDISFPGGTLTIAPGKADDALPGGSSRALLDGRSIQFPMILRKWKTADYFYPLGMRKKKKIARFLIDLKLSKTEKEAVWVLEMDKKILWVLGRRIDDRFKIKPGSSTGLELRIQGMSDER